MNLYQQIILDHNKTPRNFGQLEHATHAAEGFNPICGDHFWVELALEDERISDIKFRGNGCAISTASASMMTVQMKGKTIDEAAALFSNFTYALTGENVDMPESLQALAGVRDFPARIKCATLPWHTVFNALNASGPAKTE